MTVREMFEIIEDLVNPYGRDKVKKTINSIFDLMEIDEEKKKENSFPATGYGQF